MKDFDDNEFFKIEYVRQKFIDTAKLFDYKFMEPSPLELLSILEKKSGPAIKDEIYFFKDKGDRDIALRFDFTVGITRYVVSQKSLKLPAKFASFGGVWRYDEPQRGRYRYFHQWNIEIFGKPSIQTEAEIIEFTARLFENLELKNIVIFLNHRNLMEAFIKKIFGSDDENTIQDILRAIDKTQKKTKSEILLEYKKKGYSEKQLQDILNITEIKGRPKSFDFPLLELDYNSWNHLTMLYDSLYERGIKNVEINFGVVRGLDYYSGMIFEVFDTTSDIGALAGGGRYDSLTKAFGRPEIGATGVAGGVERIIICLDNQGILRPSQEKKISVLYATEAMQTPATNLATKLRQQGIVVDIDLVGRPLKKQMEAASNSDFTIIVGPKEFSSNSVVLRNMKERTEKTLSVDELISKSKSLLKCSG